MTKTTTRSLRLPNELDQKLQEESERTGIPMTGIILAAIQSWLNHDNITYSMKMPSGQIIHITATDGKIDQRKSA
ncbi:hypothetical protein [Nostoc sp. FACHB-110]|uniref:hypothetical protein n=1 Tax=Nostoc sp. FACHB-110 TaxID=2692834 RepID=UPI001682D84D|nr:hypothetical protein [Nostoc sp. FACHB-110]